VQRKAIVAGAVMTAAVAGALVLKKTHHESGSATETTPVASAAAAVDPAAPTAPSSSAATTVAPAAPENTPFAAPSQPLAPASGSLAAADEPLDGTGHGHKKQPHVTPFGNGPVHHGNVLRLKMDGPIDVIEGAQQPTGFAVKLPGRKSLEAAAPLAARDARIAAIKVSNDPAGAALTMNFKDGVPNYMVSARGDTLVISLAPIGSPDKLAKNDDKGAKSSKHRHEKADKSDRGERDEKNDKGDKGDKGDKADKADHKKVTAI
jgi:hypothetical protein